MDKRKVRLAAPVKIDGLVCAAGDEVEVDAQTAADLMAAGAVAADEQPAAPAEEPAVVSMTTDEIDRLVAERARVIAETIVEAAVERSVDFLTAERDAAQARAAELEAELVAMKQNSPEAGTGDAGDGGTAAAPATDTPPPATAKTTRKGAAPTKA